MGTIYHILEYISFDSCVPQFLWLLWQTNSIFPYVGKGPDTGKDWRQEEKGMTEDEMVGWHYRLDGLEFEQAQGVGDGQGSLVCCSPWGRLDMTQQWNWTDGGNKTHFLFSKADFTFHQCPILLYFFICLKF